MLGIIGGTGLYKIEGIQHFTSKKVSTPFGAPSAEITIGEIGGNRVAFLPRHGANHQVLPSEINFRANIWALKSVGVRQVISVSAVGSLKKEIRPGELVLPNQYLDWTRGKRSGTFFGDGIVAHVSTAHPICPTLSARISQQAARLGTPAHTEKTYGCVEGPRLGTRAESLFLQQSGCDLVGMTNVPEVFLAREAQLCYSTIAVVTDYDCWLDDLKEHATVDKVIELYQKNIGRVQDLIKGVVSIVETIPSCECRSSLKYAVLTREEFLSDEQRRILAFLRE